MTITQRLKNLLLPELHNIVMQYTEIPDYEPTTSDFNSCSNIRDRDNFNYHALVHQMVSIKEHRTTGICDQRISACYRNHVNFIKYHVSTERYDVSVSSRIMKTASRAVVEPYLEKLLSEKNLRKPLSSSVLDPLPTAALWAFHRYALIKLAEYDGKFLKMSGSKLTPLIEMALKKRGLDVRELPDDDCKLPLLKVLDSEVPKKTVRQLLNESNTECRYLPQETSDLTKIMFRSHLEGLMQEYCAKLQWKSSNPEKNHS